MYPIVRREKLADKIYLMDVKAPRVAQYCEPGQFVIVKIDEEGERIPLTICDYDREEGTITIVFQTVGASTERMVSLQEGDAFEDFVGPLGCPSDLIHEDIEELKKKKILFVAGGVGTAPVYPQVKWLHEHGVDCDVIMGSRNKDLLILEDEMKKVATNLYVTTDDGSYGFKGTGTAQLQELWDNGKRYDHCVAIGPMIMMKFVCKLTKELGIPTIVSMNPIMVDGTGMCGACRLVVGDEVKFACVDGPEFDGHLVDFDQAMKRQQQYKTEEGRAKLAYEEGDTHRDGRHKVGQERHAVNIVSPAAAAVLRDGVADHRADGAGQQRAGDGDEDRALEGPPDGLIVQDALLAVHAVFGDVLRRDPPLGREVRRVARVQERIVARIRQERLEREGNDGEDAREERENHKDQGDDDTAGFAERDLGDLAGLAGDSRVILAASERELVQKHDHHTEDHHDDGKNARFTRILGVHRDILGRQRAQAQIMRHRVRAHRATEDQQNCGQNRGLDHRKRNAEHGLPLGRVENGRGLFKIGVHVAENAADEDIGERRVVKAQNHQAREQALAPPYRHVDAEQSCQQAVGRAGDGVGVKKVLPHHRQGPLGHDVGEDKDGA